MRLNLGDKIRQLRREEGRTQEELATALGVTGQAVSRWEQGGSYPDMEMIPAIANFFGVSIDELFGYQADRAEKIERILAKVDAMNIKRRGDDSWVDEALRILREGLAEFPQNEKLLIRLADTLSEAGWRRHHEWLYYDEEGHMQHDYDRHRKNEYWTEAAKICKNLADTARDHGIVNEAVGILVQLYRNFGEYEKAVSYANRMPELKKCRELLLAGAVDGKEEARYIGEALLKMADEFADQLVYGLVNNVHHFETDMPIQKIQGVIGLFYLICEDGNFGTHHEKLFQLYLYLSRLQWERGFSNEAFDSLDRALEHARTLDALCGEEHAYTALLVSGVTCQVEGTKKFAQKLPEDWPFWGNPDYSQVEKEMKADPRWNAWAERTRQG